MYGFGSVGDFLDLLVLPFLGLFSKLQQPLKCVHPTRNHLELLRETELISLHLSEMKTNARQFLESDKRAIRNPNDLVKVALDCLDRALQCI